MRICIDLDGVICELRRSTERYEDVLPRPGALAKISALKAAGHEIIIFTARHSKTCQGNVGKILARQGLATLAWLDRHKVVYDEIHFGKPYADVYIDDNAHRFISWDEISDDATSLPMNCEKKLLDE